MSAGSPNHRAAWGFPTVFNVSFMTCENGYWREPLGTEKEMEAFYGEVSFISLSIIENLNSSSVRFN